MYEGEEMYLMIASSGKQGSIKKRDKNQSALDGVMYNLALFKQKFQGKCHDHIVTSQDRKTLLSKQYICNWLLNYFKQTTADVYLFFTGHGHKNGDWAIQTQEKPSGDTLTFEEFVGLWRGRFNQTNKKNRDAHLYLFMDSCYSGNWSSKLANSTQRFSISIFTSCREDQKSTGMEGGGLLNRCLLTQKPIQLQYDIQLLFNPAMKQEPQFINGDVPSVLNAGQVKQLAQNLKNAWSIKQSNPQKSDGKKQEEMERYKNKMKKEEQLKDQIVKSAQNLKEHNDNVVNWESLKETTKLYLYEQGLSELPQSLGELTQLKELYLHRNPLGHIPECILRLHNLEKLGIHDIKLEHLPQNLGQKLPNLLTLWMQSNRLRRLPSSFGNLQKLKQLSITIEPDSEFGLSQIPLSPKLIYLDIHLKKETSQQEKEEFQNKCKNKNIQLTWESWEQYFK